MRIVDLEGVGRSPGTAVTEWGSTGVEPVNLLRSTEGGAATVLRFAPHSRLGRHPAGWAQLFHVVDGEGWVSGDDGTREPVGTGQAALWQPGEPHESGSDTGMTVLVVEAPHVAAFPLADTTMPDGPHGE